MCWANVQPRVRNISKGQFTRNVVTLWPFASLIHNTLTSRKRHKMNMQMSASAARKGVMDVKRTFMMAKLCRMLWKGNNEKCEFAIKIYSPFESAIVKADSRHHTAVIKWSLPPWKASNINKALIIILVWQKMIWLEDSNVARVLVVITFARVKHREFMDAIRGKRKCC